MMYARYIPPPKPVAAAQPSTVQTPAAPRDGFSYARYVPSAKPSQSAKEVAKIQFFDDHGASPKAKRKREAGEVDGANASQPGGKKLRKTESQRGDKPEQPQSVITEETKKKKKTRRKRKQRTRAADDDTEESEDHDSDSDTAGSPSKSAKMTVSRAQKAEELQSAALTNGAHQKSLQASEPVAADSPITDQPAAREVREKKRKEKKDTDGKTKKKDKEEKAERREKKREEKKKARDGAENGADIPEPIDEDEDSQRHKAILKRKEISLKLASASVQETDPEPGDKPAEPHGLEPLPQPLLVEEKVTAPTHSALPSWLAKPIRVSQNHSTPFQKLGILPKAARMLAEKGFKEAFAVQTAAIPLLLPSEERPSDVLIAAATGSGKTLAYALPIVRDISQGIVTRLRALVVLPTRELVKQAQEVFEVCARAHDGEQRKRVRIGVALGSQSIKNEQEALLSKESRYDPEAYEEACALIREERGRKAAMTGLEEELNLHADPRLGVWEGEVVDFTSKVDVLICTPGRLVEHMDQTPGFSLDYVRWLVVDEADKILAQSFQGWLERVMAQFRNKNKFGARDFLDVAYVGVRKVVLSATLTRDLSLLNQLALRRPRLVVLEEEGAGEVAEHTLPVSLKEFAIRVHESSLKPLYLLELLQGPHMTGKIGDGEESGLVNGASKTSSDAASSSTDSESESSRSSSDEGSNPRTNSNGEPVQARSKIRQLPHALIFTKSNEAALRLSRLLELLDSSLAPHISTLTSATPTHIRRKTLRAFTEATSSVRLIIASDLVARGIDIPNLGHVINYDLPPSLAGYVHRVGRTARAGRPGCAWTLVSDDESGWFWGKIGKGQSVKRAQKLVRTKIEEMDEEIVERYQAALATLGKEAVEVKRHGVKERRQK